MLAAGENFKAAKENFKAAGESSKAEWERVQKDSPYYLARRIDMLDSSVKDLGNRIDKQLTDLGNNVTDLRNDMDKLVFFVTILQSMAGGALAGVGITSMSDITQLFHKTPLDATCTTEAAASDSMRNEKKRRPSLPFVTPVASALPRFNSQSLQRVSFPPTS
ncbi:hypothetical protein JKP88DRAFT_354524 [Tribonema minus]|uniref:Uncharacterized protein n=1 Tax=Tribonema minus TaxID=303371 RepID=A0A835YZY3_9STRA|nr:hypothetical protein JKP88DRAFT_354524 [Tribonema minus]